MARVKAELPWRTRGIHRYRAIVKSTKTLVENLTFQKIVYSLTVIALSCLLVVNWFYIQPVPPKFIWDKTQFPNKALQISFAVLSIVLGGLLCLPIFHWAYKTRLETTRLVMQLIQTELRRAQEKTGLISPKKETSKSPTSSESTDSAFSDDQVKSPKNVKHTEQKRQSLLPRPVNSGKGRGYRKSN